MNIVWLKRDLRVSDHQPLFEASSANKPFCVIYIFEPKYSHQYDFDIKHWRFVYQSLQNLIDRGLKVEILYCEALKFFKSLSFDFTLYSHMETGGDFTFKRDLEVKKYLQKRGLAWKEFQQHGVIRGLKSRKGWDAKWIKYVKAEIIPTPSQLTTQKLDHDYFLPHDLLKKLEEDDDTHRVGGEDKAKHYLEDFLSQKINSYWGSLSYPEKSHYYTSRLSPYISWGNISIRQIYQACEARKSSVLNKKSLNQYMSRLKWHCHFIQKLESAPSIEFDNLSPAFNHIRNHVHKKYFKAWVKGGTGYPLIDAAMRCLFSTGHISFRLRATITSFYTHLLWQPWQSASGPLARMFLDYEPGIHFSQLQMQAGTTGINMIRIYNPIKQSREKDSEGEFIKKWVPELRHVPKEFIHTPWEMSEMEQVMFNVRIGEDYPSPIVEFDQAYKNARDQLWKIKSSKTNKSASQDILAKHVRKTSKRRSLK